MSYSKGKRAYAETLCSEKCFAFHRHKIVLRSPDLTLTGTLLPKQREISVSLLRMRQLTQVLQSIYPRREQKKDI